MIPLEKVPSLSAVGAFRSFAFCCLAGVSFHLPGLCRFPPAVVAGAAGCQGEAFLWLGLHFHAHLECRGYLVGLECFRTRRPRGLFCQQPADVSSLAWISCGEETHGGYYRVLLTYRLLA